MKITLLLAISIIALPVASSTVNAAEPLMFQSVMRDLGKHMQTVTGAIAHEDWELVAKTAPLIAEHPQPPLTERMRIMSFIGSNMDKFKEFDTQTHEGAHEMEHAAIARNGVQVINAFQKVQTSCLQCHQAFRAPFVEHFYGNKPAAEGK